MERKNGVTQPVTRLPQKENLIHGWERPGSSPSRLASSWVAQLVMFIPDGCLGNGCLGNAKLNVTHLRKLIVRLLHSHKKASVRRLYCLGPLYFPLKDCRVS